MVRVVLFTLGLTVLSGCSFLNSLVYKIDIPQGNYIDSRQVEKLRVGMTKEQVNFVLGTPVASNPFDQNTWHYLYRYKTGKGVLLKKELIVAFDDNNKLNKVEGDYKVSEHFNVPIEQDLPSFEEAIVQTKQVSDAPKESSLWSIRLGEFEDAAHVKRLRIQLEQAGYQVYLFPNNPVPGEKTTLYADAGTTAKELEEKVKVIAELTKTQPEIARLPES